MCLFVFYVSSSSNHRLVYIMIVAFPDHSNLLTTNTKQSMLEITKGPTLGGLIIGTLLF